MRGFCGARSRCRIVDWGDRMFLDRHRYIADLTNVSRLEAPPLEAARGIILGVALSAILWGLIIAVVWLLAR